MSAMDTIGSASHVEKVAEIHRLRAIIAELIDTLKDWDNAICNGFDDYEGRMTGRRVLIKTRALLAKAKGETP